MKDKKSFDEAIGDLYDAIGNFFDVVARELKLYDLVDWLDKKFERKEK